MDEERDAVLILLQHLFQNGMEWYRNASLAVPVPEVSSGRFKLCQVNDSHYVRNQPVGTFPEKTLLVMRPPKKEKEPFLGMWLSWNFSAANLHFSLYLNLWRTVGQIRKHIGFRYEPPEFGDEHNFWHLQPCNNIGDKNPIPECVLFSNSFLTVPINAGNIVDLVLCAMLSIYGKDHIQNLRRKMLSNVNLSSNKKLMASFKRVLV